MGQQKTLSLFLKRLLNLAHRKVTDKARTEAWCSEPPSKKKSKGSTPQGFWDR